MPASPRSTIERWRGGHNNSYEEGQGGGREDGHDDGRREGQEDGQEDEDSEEEMMSPNHLHPIQLAQPNANASKRAGHEDTMALVDEWRPMPPDTHDVPVLASCNKP